MVTERDLNAERNQLEAWARSSKTPARLQRRSRLVLAIFRGTPLKRIAREQRVPFAMVKRWRKRYVERGLPALEKDAPRRVPPRLPKEKVAAILEATLHSKPPGATHWSTRTMAAAQAVSQGRCGTMTHDDKRNGTTTLFTALDVSRGSVITDCMPRHRHQEFLRFMKQVEAETPKHLDPHVILDNYSTHKHASVQRWLKRNPRVHFIPTSSSWFNPAWRWFRDLTDKAIRRGGFARVEELIDAINAYVATWQHGAEFVRLAQDRPADPREGRQGTRPCWTRYTSPPEP